MEDSKWRIHTRHQEATSNLFRYPPKPKLEILFTGANKALSSKTVRGIRSMLYDEHGHSQGCKGRILLHASTTPNWNQKLRILDIGLSHKRGWKTRFERFRSFLLWPTVVIDVIALVANICKFSHHPYFNFMFLFDQFKFNLTYFVCGFASQ